MSKIEFQEICELVNTLQCFLESFKSISEHESELAFYLDTQRKQGDLEREIDEIF
jgi:hypothetical protein